ncbi:hypothetical protein [Hyphomicrobium sp.]|uniref:hypothetical protein n=1 Tax=Hyphomicrobium sp. TaxID=82 RepID=UPI002E304287|nr:hypothetical protein [Hyphomicrobium sp.]HEX2842422.1 hypothetical protein [Hyphomicrobium sp.]
MCRLFSFPMWFVLSLIWVGIVAYFGYTTTPHVPMDMSANDPATVEALRAATGKHAIMYGLLAAVPPAIALLFGRLMCRRA